MPYTGIVLAFLAFHAAAFLILLGHWVAAAGMFPQATRAFTEQYDRRPLRAVLLGVFTYGPLIVLLLNSAKIPNAAIRIVIVVAGFTALLIAFIGSTGLALRIGRNLCAEADTWRQALRGGVMLALVFITPLLGSFFLLHVGLASGFGVFLLARPWKAKAPPLPVEVPGPASAIPSLS
jgi:hypothetical protein